MGELSPSPRSGSGPAVRRFTRDDRSRGQRVRTDRRARQKECPMSTDAIVMLKEDHVRIRKLFREFQQAGDGAIKTKGGILTRILEELTVHTYLENEVMYPRVRNLLPDLKEDVLESYEEHHVA